MLDREGARKIAAAILERAKSAGADEAECEVSGGREALTRFAVNEVHQNVEATTVGASLRVVLGKKTARTSTSKLDDDGIVELVARTIEVAKLVPDDKDLLPVLSAEEAGDASDTSLVDPETDAFSPEQRAAIAKKAIDAAANAGLEAAGYVACSRGGRGPLCYANSRGLVRGFDRTSASFGMTVQAKDSSGWCDANAPKKGALDVDKMIASAVEKARASANPTDVEPGEWDVVLEPAAVQGLTEFLGWGGFSGRAYVEGDTWSAGLLGKKVLGENVTMRDDVSDERNPAAHFDGEGMARTHPVLVKNGVITSLCWDRRTAKKQSTAPTGHSAAVPSLYGGGPENIIVEGASTSVADMIAGTKKGILVTRFWYIREVDPKKVVLTGMTRDGTFLIEDGKIARGLKNMRFNQGVIAMLNAVEAMSSVDPSFLVPAMKVRGFTFSSKTKF